MQWFAAPDPDEPELVGVLELDALPVALHVYDDAFAIWMTEDGVVVDAFEMPSA